MTVIKVSDEDRNRAAEMLAHAETHCAGLIDELAALRDRLRVGEPPSDAEMKRTLAEVRRAFQTVCDERGRLNELRKRHAGVVHDYAIDFDAARDEIRRKLDRLRAASRPRGVPE